MAKDKATLRMSTSVVSDTKKLKRQTLAEFKQLLGIVSKPSIPYHRYEKVQHQTEDGITVERRKITVFF